MIKTKIGGCEEDIMRKKLFTIMLGLTLICTGCGSNKNSDETVKQSLTYDTYNGYDAAPEDTTAAADMDMQEVGGLGEQYESAETDSVYDSDMLAEEMGNPAVQANGSKTGEIKQEMLVYRGELNIDTLDYAASVNAFKMLISEKGGFIETESYTDNFSNSGYYAVDASDKRNLYSATVRVPSKEYDAVMNSATDLGDVRSRYSNASNVTQQYGTYQSQLEIYQAEYDRYLELLKNATEDEYALMIENELFDIQLQIATLKSSISNIENDVAYSYIDITIKEVSEYEERIEVRDTFFERFKRTCKNSWRGFLDVLEEFLFWIIMNIYWIVAIAVIVIIVRIMWKKKKHSATGFQNQGMIMQAGVQNPNVIPQTDIHNQGMMSAEGQNVTKKEDSKENSDENND